jgi:hypothetical protein
VDELPFMTSPCILFYRNPQASILKSETIKDNDAPTVASFSSRGPNSIALDIMKV